MDDYTQTDYTMTPEEMEAAERAYHAYFDVTNKAVIIEQIDNGMFAKAWKARRDIFDDADQQIRAMIHETGAKELPKDDKKLKALSKTLARKTQKIQSNILPQLECINLDGASNSVFFFDHRYQDLKQKEIRQAIADNRAWQLETLFNNDPPIDLFSKTDLRAVVNLYFDGKEDETLDLLKSLIDKASAAEKATIKRADKIEYPLDKPNSKIWNLLEENTEGQITIAFNLAKRGSQDKITAFYSIDFDGLGNDIKITKRLLPFDKRVYVAVNALFNAGNNVITLSQIYYAMGYTGKPGTKDLTKINDAVTKMTTARILFDNEQEAVKYKYNHFKYDGSLLPLERGAVIVNGQLTDAAIHIFREPPLITFAKQRGQITTLDVKLLQSPISKTDANLLIDDYLLERISRAKNNKNKSCRILFKTLYENTDIPDKPKTNTERQQKKRAPDKVKKYLEHYQKEGFISRFTMEKDGITVYWQ